MQWHISIQHTLAANKTDHAVSNNSRREKAGKGRTGIKGKTGIEGEKAWRQGIIRDGRYMRIFPRHGKNMVRRIGALLDSLQHGVTFG